MRPTSPGRPYRPGSVTGTGCIGSPMTGARSLWESAGAGKRITNTSANWRRRTHHVQQSLRKILSVTTFGESHGPAIGCVIDGCPPGLAIAPEEFRHDLTVCGQHFGQRHAFALAEPGLTLALKMVAILTPAWREISSSVSTKTSPKCVASLRPSEDLPTPIGPIRMRFDDEFMRGCSRFSRAHVSNCACTASCMALRWKAKSQ